LFSDRSSYERRGTSGNTEATGERIFERKASTGVRSGISGLVPVAKFRRAFAASWGRRSAISNRVSSFA